MANTPERNNASAATEHRKFRRGLYSARGVQSNGRHNNTWTPAVNFSWPAGDVAILWVQPLLVFSSGATHRPSSTRGAPSPRPYTYLSCRKRPLSSL